MQNFTKKLQK